MRAQACCAAWLAVSAYDPSRGVPFGAFAHQRILTSVLTRYRQEWAFAIHCGAVETGDGAAEFPADSPRGVAGREVIDCISATLGRSDRALLRALFWQDRSEATIARAPAASPSRRSASGSGRCWASCADALGDAFV